MLALYQHFVKFLIFASSKIWRGYEFSSVSDICEFTTLSYGMFLRGKRKRETEAGPWTIYITNNR